MRSSGYQTRVLMVADATAFTRIPSYASLAARFVVNEVIRAIANEYSSLRRRGSVERAGAFQGLDAVGGRGVAIARGSPLSDHWSNYTELERWTRVGYERGIAIRRGER